jgi:hypothetical protein
MVEVCGGEKNKNSFGFSLRSETIRPKIDKIKNASDFYERSPFLTPAKELLLALQENLIEELIFLSAYNQDEFPSGDARKLEKFQKTFGKFPNCRMELLAFFPQKPTLLK